MQNSINDYEKFVLSTQKYPRDVANEYLIMGLVSEAGEVAGVWKRFLRQDISNLKKSDIEEQLLQELGDVLWYVTALCLQNNISLEELIAINTEKLAKRLENNTIKGKGDNR